MVYYEPIPASDGTSLTAPSNAEFRVFEVSDTARATPLELRTVAGTNAAPLVTTAQGVLPGVEVVSPNFSHIFKSGEWEWRRDSVEGIRKAAEEARADALDASAAASNAWRAAEDASQNAAAPTQEAVATALASAGPAREALAEEVAQRTSGLAVKPDNGGKPVGKGELVINAADHGPGVVGAQAALDAAANMQGTVTVIFPPSAAYDMGGKELSVGSGTNIQGNGAIFRQSTKGRVAVFALAPGVSNVTITGCDLRGPWYGINSDTFVGGGNLAAWNAEHADNIGIDIRGRWYQREVLKYSHERMQTLDDDHTNITVSENKIEGFGQSGILADQVTVFHAAKNSIYRNGRDGIRMYGVRRGVVEGNDIGDLFPAYADGLAPNFNMYGIAATRLYGKAGWADPENLIGRPTQDVLITGNHVFRCPTWKGLDTHGGVRIQFIANTVEDCNICIGIDKGGYDAVTGYAPARDIVVTGNVLRSTSASKYMRAGIAAYGHDSTDSNILDGLLVGSNVFDGVGGGDTDAAVSLSNARSVAIAGNTFRNASRACIAMALDVREASIAGNVMHDPRSYITANVTSGGSGYVSRPTVTVSGGGGVGLKAIALVANGAVTSVSIIHPGRGYTSTPILTLSGGGGSGATATAQFNVGYGVLSQTPTARASVVGNAFINQTQATMTAISLRPNNPGYGVKVSADNSYTGTILQLANPSAEAGGSRRMASIAWANINLSGSAASASTGQGIASIVRGGVGNVQVTLTDQATTAANAFIVNVTIKGSVPCVTAVNATSPGVFNVRVFDMAGAPTDVGFYMSVHGQ